jgi:hypothetical protein
VDLGANTGRYSRLALEAVAIVIAVDQDSGAIDRLYTEAKGIAGLFPVVSSLLNPTPAMGWNLRERRSLPERLAADRFLALALVHHLRVTGSVPLTEIVRSLMAVAPEGVIEWVGPDDPMARSMLTLRPPVYDDYSWAVFEAAVRASGELVARQDLASGRRLCHVRRRAPGAS